MEKGELALSEIANHPFTQIIVVMKNAIRGL